MREAIVLLARGAHSGAALFGLAVIVLGGAQAPLVLGFVALGILAVTVADAWGFLAASPLVALTVVFAAGGPVALAFLVVVTTVALAVARCVARRRTAAAAPISGRAA